MSSDVPVPDMDVTETRSLLRTLTAYALYRPTMHAVIQQKRQDYIALSSRHKELLPDYLDKLQVADDAIDDNSVVAEAILSHASVAMLGAVWNPQYKVDDVTDSDMSKVRSTLKQLHRDWSLAGRNERKLCYWPILYALDAFFFDREDLSQVRVLTPGCGLGRLTYEIAFNGFVSVGNEQSYPMLVCSNFITNCNLTNYQYTMHLDPHVFSNRMREAATYQVPDVVPGEKLASLPGKFSMAMGDFVESFSGDEHVDTFDAVATCFFLDTAHNIIDYIEVIRRVLKPGGYLINLGPFLFHHENASLGRKKHGNASTASHDEKGHYIGSIEIDASELQALMQRMGFSWLEQNWHKMPYLGDPASRLTHEYEALFFVAQLVQQSPD